MSGRTVFKCETCNALFTCLKFFQDHRRMHAQEGGKILKTCNYCPQTHEDEFKMNWHVITHKNEQEHRCEICQQNDNSISDEKLFESRRSIGTATNDDLYFTNVTLLHKNKDTPEEEEVEEEEEEEEEDDDEDEESEDEEEEEGDEEEEDDDEEDEEEDEEDDGEIDETSMYPDQMIANNAPNNINITNSICISNNTINTVNAPSTRASKSSRPSRSTGKGKGNRKARLTTDGDIRRKFQCCHCGKSFKTKSHLQRHILTHTGEKPYHCNRCGGKFNQSSSLRNHVIAIHTKEYPHMCNNCHKGFLMPALLQRHLQTSPRCGATNQVVDMGDVQ